MYFFIVVVLVGLFCNRTFDRYACWPDAPAGHMINISCPFYLPWYDKGILKVALIFFSPQMWIQQMMLTFRVLYTVGYSVSLATLVTRNYIFFVIVSSERRLRCTRNYIHANLFLSFILRAAAVIIKDRMLDQQWGKEILNSADVKEILSYEVVDTLCYIKVAVGCKIAQVMMQYFVLANHYWFFGEAIYLYTVLIASVFIDSNKYLPYICLGWGTPLFFVVPWMVMKMLKENKDCWAVNENMSYWWIIRFPVLFTSLVVNFIIFVKILRVIFTKLRAETRIRTLISNFGKLAKATLTLIPLFGIHEVIFIFATDEQTTGTLRYIKVFFSLFISSFQGFLVAILYCYANKEVCCFYFIIIIYFF
uniref:G-protein coupled receptors family 2 profile 2 domain-containing protein n=1 Tax=Gouania willdenowi TaxID=441366 RepID=A0A8C5EFF3_GOUWI